MGSELGSGKSKLQDLIIELMNKGRCDVDDANINIELEHEEVHEGNSFVVTVTAAVATSLSVSLKTGTTKEIHMTVGYASESKAHLDYIEETAITATTGTATDIINRYRDSPKTSTVLQNKSGAFVAGKVTVDATTVGGNTIITHYTWADKKYGFNRRGIAEYILMANTEYEFLLTSDDGAKGLHLELNWYEVTV